VKAVGKLSLDEAPLPRVRAVGVCRSAPGYLVHVSTTQLTPNAVTVSKGVMRPVLVG
jgi:hypothetical protein